MVTVPTVLAHNSSKILPLAALSATTYRIAVIAVTALRSANVNPIVWAYRDLH
jgi:hypothetical protein